MRASITGAAWIELNRDLEGYVFHMYPDQNRDEHGNIRPIPTTAMGNAMLTPAAARAYPWMMGDRRATASEVNESWYRTSEAVHIALLGGDSKQARALNPIRLTQEGVELVIASALAAFDEKLAKRFGAAWEDAPEGVQMATLSMVWAMGEAGLDDFPKFCAGFRAGDWETCARECHVRGEVINVGGKLVPAPEGTLATRNALNLALFLAAASTPLPTVVVPVDFRASIRKAIEHDSDNDEEPPGAA